MLVTVTFREEDIPTNGDCARRSVYVFAPDPLLRAGAVMHLGREAGLPVVDAEGVDAGTVVVAVTDRFDSRVADAVVGPRRRGARGAVLVVDELDVSGLIDAVGCGVDAVLWRREATGEALRRTVAAVWSGGGRLPADLLGHLLGAVRGARASAGPRRPTRALSDLLTARETEVLRLAADGYGTHEIADRLSYSERTIKAILHGVTERLQLRNRTHAVAFLIRHGAI
jgi:DNA-binding NarL/FixJ family response regulator